MKAMLLAAGRGSRLKPLTDSTPKPLLTIGSVSLIEHNIQLLKQAGIHDVVINVCHHAEKIMATLGNGQRFGVNINYVQEGEHPLGTGGGILNALPVLGDEPFIVISADIWSDFAFPASFMQADSEAHLLLVDNPYYNSAGDYALNADGQLSKQGNKFNYGGIAKLQANLFTHCQRGVFSLSPLFNEAIERGAASGEYYHGSWFNVGTLQELENLRAIHSS